MFGALGQRVRLSALFALTAAGLAAFPLQVHAADPGYSVTGTFTYELRPARREVRVTGLLTFTSHRPDWQFEWYEFAVEQGARRVRVTPERGLASAEFVDTDEGARRLRINFSPIATNESRIFRVTYELPGGARTERTISRAYADFCVDMRAFDRGSIRVLFPTNYISSPPRGMSSEVRGSNKLYTRGVHDTPDGIGECFDGYDPDAWTAEAVALKDGSTITIEAWEDDPEWAEAVRTAIQSDLPALTATLGERDGPELVRIREALPGYPYLAGFDPSKGSLGLGAYAADGTFVTDQLAALWFGKDLFHARWLTVGHAEWSKVAAGIQDDCPDAPKDRTTYSLSDWLPGPPGVAVDEDPAHSEYVRAASCAIVSTVAETVGSRAYLDSVEALRSGTDPFTQASISAGPRGTVGWAEWLDAVELLALLPSDADPTIASDLLEQYDASLSDELDSRAEAHAAYRELIALLGQPGPPAVVDPLRDWEFEAAEEAITLAAKAWAAGDAAVGVLPELSDRTSRVQEAVRNAVDKEALMSALSLGEEQLELASEAVRVLGEGSGSPDILSQLGLLGAHPPSPDDLIDAVASVDQSRAARLWNDFQSAHAGARMAGVQRLIAAALVLVVLVVSVITIVRRRGRAKRDIGARTQ